MRRWIAFAAKLYPRRWRERYGAEFDALMEDVEPDWRELANVLGGALMAQMTNEIGYLKLAVTMAVAGAIAGGGVSFRVPDRYISTAVMRITAQPDPAQPSTEEDAGNRASFRMQGLTMEILSRFSLLEIIVDPALDLYKKERARMPMENVIDQMRNRDLRVQPLAPDRGNRASTAFTISFSYPDKEKAQAVVNRLTTQFAKQNAADKRGRDFMWRVWGRDLTASGLSAVSHEPPPPGESLEVLDPASLPSNGAGPRRLVFMAAGLGAGLLVGLMATSAMRRPRWTLRMAGFALSGCALAAAASFLIPDRFTSTVVMRVTPPLDAKRWYGVRGPLPAAERVQQITQQVLSPASLERIIRKPELNLYEKQRGNTPMKDIVAKMRSQDIDVQMLGAPPAAAFRISFTYSDRGKAQAVVRYLMVRFEDCNLSEQHERAKTASEEYRSMAEHKAGENLELLDPVSLPEYPAAPNRMAIATAGLSGGLVLGIFALWLQSRRAQRA